MKINILGTTGDYNCTNTFAEGVEDDTDFVEYLDDPFSAKLEDGYMSFVTLKGILHTKTQYRVKEGEFLTDEEISRLMSYTQGQWSDGIGESFEQFSLGENDEGDEIYISPWHHGQKIFFEIEN